MRAGWFTIGLAQGSLKFGITFTAEVGNSILYPLGQNWYARNLKVTEPVSRAIGAVSSARRAILRGDMDLTRFELQRSLKAAKSVEDTSPGKAPDIIPLIIEASLDMPESELNETDKTQHQKGPSIEEILVARVEKGPTKAVEEEIAEKIEDVALRRLGPEEVTVLLVDGIMEEFNTQVRSFPTQRNPID